MKDIKNRSNIISILLVSVLSLLTYYWTITLPISCDGLMHMNDRTEFFPLKNIIKIFYTFEGVGKPENTPTLQFHRPVFNEIIVTITKCISNYDTEIIRCVSVVVFMLLVIYTYILGKELFQNNIKAVALAFLMNFSVVFFPGMYEYGLSFSIWLTLFVILSFYFAVKYEKYEQKKYIFLTLLFTFLAMFTKESTMCLGIALSWYIFVNDIHKNKKLTWKTFRFGLCQFILLIVYLYTRYLKLGSLFTAAVVNSDKVTIFAILRKIYGYFLLAFNLSNSGIEDYMYIREQGIAQWLKYPMYFFCLYILVRGIYLLCKHKENGINILSFLGMYLLLLVPVFKTNRNAPNYGDICTAFIFLFVLSVIKFDSKRINIVNVMILGVFISLFFLNIYNSVQKGSGYYLSVQSNACVELQKQLRDIAKNVEQDQVIFTTNWKKDSNTDFIYNHGGNGSFYTYNVDRTKKVDLVNEVNIKDDATFIDCFEDLNTNKMKIFVYPQEETKIVELKYSDDNENVAIGFSYEGTYYYSNIDVKYKKFWNNDNYIYCVIPKECVLEVVGVNCSVNYLTK